MATVKATITLDEEDLKKIRGLVAAGKVASISGFVQHAVTTALHDVAGSGAILSGALTKRNYPRPDWIYPSTAVYELADYHFGLKVLPAAELEAYGERLTALARLLRHGDPHPAGVTEWLVATAEEPLTRREATGELLGALSALAMLAEKRGTTTEQAAEDLRAVADRFVADGGSFGSDAEPALAAAFLTEAQQERLSEAFQATPRLTEADLELFAVVQPWAGDAAVAALIRKFQAAEPSEDGFDRQVMDLLVTELDDAELKALLEEANAEIEGHWSAMPQELTEEDEKLLEEKSAATEKELRRRFVRALGGRR
jgi:hypothetical protein